MIKIIHGDLLESQADYLCHQVNCRGVMGSGVAKQIRDKWPSVYENYKGLCQTEKANPLLGTVQAVRISDAQTVLNLFAQLNYGRDGKCYTDIHALNEAFQKVSKIAGIGTRVAMPYRIGCGLGGGDWGIVMDMLSEIFREQSLTLYKKAS